MNRRRETVYVVLFAHQMALEDPAVKGSMLPSHIGVNGIQTVRIYVHTQCCIHESSVEEMDPIVECLAHLSLHKVVYLDYLPPPLLLDCYSSHPAPNLILVPPPSHLSLGHAAELVGSDPLAGRSR